MPPTAEDPLLARIAPEECVFYSSWAGTAKADPQGTNHTERLLAEKEVRQMVVALQRAVALALTKTGPPDKNTKVLLQESAKIAKTILTKPGAIFVGGVKLNLRKRKVDVDAGLIVNCGEDTAEVMKTVFRIESALGDKVKEVEAGGVTWKEFPVPQGMPRIVWGFRGRYLILGVGEDSATQIIKRASGKVPTWLTKLRTQLSVPRTSSVTYVNVERILALAQVAIPDEDFKPVMTALGFANVKHFAAVGGFDKTGYVRKSLLSIDGEAQGLFTLAGGKGLTLEDLAPIPKDATLAVVARLDPEKIFRDFKAGVAAADPRAIERLDEELEEVQRELSLNFSADIFKPLGDTWRIYNSPGEGGLIVSGLTAVVSVRDAKRLRKTLTRIEEIAQQQAQRYQRADRRRPRRHVTVKHFEFAGEKVYFMNFIGAESPVAPAWCLKGDQLVISLYPSHVKSFLRRGADFQSIAQNPVVAKLFSGDKRPVMLSYQDTRALLRVAYPFIQFGAQFAASELQREGVDVDISMLPSFEAIARHAHPGTVTVTKTKQGIEMVSRQTLPIGGGSLWMTIPLLLLANGGDSVVVPAVEFRAAPAAAADFPE